MITIEKKVHFRRGSRSRKELRDGPAPVENVVRVPRIAKLMALAIRFDQLIRDGVVSDQAELARLGHVSRARLTQIMNLLNLAPDIQEALLFLEPVKKGREAVTERHLREITAQESWTKQRSKSRVSPIKNNSRPCRDKSNSNRLEFQFTEIRLLNLQWHDQNLISDKKRDALLLGIKAFVEKHSDNPALVVMDQINDPYPFLSWILALMAMTWRFVLSKKTQLVTCDNPLFFFKSRGVGKPNSEITFPIDSQLVLFGSYQPLAGSPVLRNAKWAEKEANRRIISNAGRFVFAKRAEDWIATVAAKRQPHLSEIRWISFETVEQPAL